MAERRSPGWYRDEHDPAQFRHWNGRGWSGRHRSMPAWMLSDTDVAPDAAWGSLQPTAGGPNLEGPVRPTPLPAGTRYSLAEHRERGGTQRLIRPAAGGGRGPGPGRWGAGATPAATPGWVSGRRPLMVFCALVAVAVLMMGATVVGVNRTPDVALTPLGHDPGFVSRASSVCDAGLRVLRAPAPAMTSPGGATTALVTSAERSSAVVGSVEQQLRTVPVLDEDATSVGGWLDDLGRYVVDEEQLALTLGGAGSDAGTGSGTTSGTGSSPTGTEHGTTAKTGGASTPAETAATRVTADISQADAFADANGLSACSLAPSSGASPLVSIP